MFNVIKLYNMSIPIKNRQFLAGFESLKPEQVSGRKHSHLRFNRFARKIIDKVIT